MSIADNRANAIKHWLSNTLNLRINQFEIASSDASFRRYFRVIHSEGQHIVMDAPPEKENTEPFIRIASLLKANGLNVPQIVQQESVQGLLLLEDFGSCCFLDQLNDKNAIELYNSAFSSLYQLQAIPALTLESLPCYDEALLSRELGIFYQWFLEQYLQLAIPVEIKQPFNNRLILSALEQPQVCVHRDFHCRNLMYLQENSPGIIDFQDAVTGPISYDLVSLLRDCYISWPEEKVLQWMTQFFHHQTESGLINSDLDTFTRWFDLMGLQRHLKAIGIFSRLNLRDSKPEYMADIPRTLNYVQHITSKYPELNEFNLYLVETILPAYHNKK